MNKALLSHEHDVLKVIQRLWSKGHKVVTRAQLEVIAAALGESCATVYGAMLTMTDFGYFRKCSMCDTHEIAFAIAD
jgi:hypothetical protein